MHSDLHPFLAVLKSILEIRFLAVRSALYDMVYLQFVFFLLRTGIPNADLSIPKLSESIPSKPPSPVEAIALRARCRFSEIPRPKGGNRAERCETLQKGLMNPYESTLVTYLSVIQ